MSGSSVAGMALLALLAGTAAACATGRGEMAPPATPMAEPPFTAPAPPASTPPWLSTGGTTNLGFGILRVAPAAGAATASFRIRFRDHGDGGYASDATSACVVVLRSEPFATAPGVFADAWLGFGRAEADPGAGVVEADATFTVEGDRTVVVAYGPWDGADTGRPPSDVHTFTLSVEPLDGGRWRWVESEAGEMVTTNWTGRPGVERGGPYAGAGAADPLWIESRVLVLYDPRNARSAAASTADEREKERLALPPDLFTVLEGVPIRWR